MRESPSGCRHTIIQYLEIVLIYDFKKKYSKRRFSPKQCELAISYPHPQQWTAKSTARLQNGGFLASNTPKRPHHPTATDLVGMKDPYNKPRLTQNGGHQLLA